MTPYNLQLVVQAVNQFSQTFGELNNELKSVRGRVALVAAEFTAIKMAATTAFNAVASVISPAINAIDQFQTSVVKTAAMITSFQGAKGDVGKNYRIAKEYAEQLLLKLQEIDANTIAGADDLSIMTEEMLKQGIVLDINNKKQVDGFTNIANAAAVVAQGAGAKEIQVRQEIRALMQGEVNAQSQLASQINAMVGGTLKQKVALWKQEGTIIENIGGLLTGYAAASGDLQSLWSTIKSTMQTIANQVLRGGFVSAFADIVAMARQLSAWAQQHKADLQSGIHRTWLAIKGTIEVVTGILTTQSVTASLLASLVGKIFDGWGMILYVVLPPLTDRFVTLLKLLNAIVNAGYAFGLAMFDSVAAVGAAIVSVGKAAFQALTGDFEEAGKTLGTMMSSAFADRLKDDMLIIRGAFSAVGEEWNNLKDPFGDMDRRLTEYQKKFDATRKIVATPQLPTPPKADDQIKLAREAVEAELKAKLEALTQAHNEVKALLKEQDVETEQRYKSGEIDEITYLKNQNDNRKKALLDEKQLLQEEAALRTEYQQKVEFGKSNEEQSAAIKSSGDYRAEMAKIRSDIKVKETEIRAESTKSATIIIDATNKIAKARRDGEIKNLEELIALEKERLSLRYDQGDISSLDQKRQELLLERQLVEARKNAALANATAPGVKTEDKQKYVEEFKTLGTHLDGIDNRLKGLGADQTWTAGIKRGLRSIIEESQNMGEQISSALTSAFKGMEDGLVTFVQTSKISFKSLADSIIADLLRIITKSQVTGPLATALQSINWGSFFSSSSGTAPSYSAYSSGSYAGSFSSLIKHDGGLVVPRFHFGGLASDEIPAILQRGERVLDREHNALMERFANKTEGGNTNLTVELINNTGTQMKTTQGQTRFDGKGMVKQIFLEALDTDPGFRSAVRG